MKAGIILFPGINRERDMAIALEAGMLEAQKELLDKVKATRLKMEVRFPL